MKGLIWMTSLSGSDFSTHFVLDEVHDERLAQGEKWGEQNHPDMVGSDVAQQETRAMFRQFAEDYRAINDGHFHLSDPDQRLDWTGILLEEVYEALAESDPVKLRAELVQVAAVAVAWVEAIDRRADDS